jgi:hypothetical protein
MGSTRFDALEDEGCLQRLFNRLLGLERNDPWSDVSVRL